MFRCLILCFALCLSSTVFSQKEVSVVELFCNTGDYDARLSIPDLKSHAEVADTSDQNHLFIQYHVPQQFGNWSDQYATAASENRFNNYVSLGILDSVSGICKNGEVSTASPWYNCEPLEKNIYSSGAKKVTVLYESYDASSSTAAIRFVLGRKYTTAEAKSIHVLLLESDIVVSVIGGENTGETFSLHNVARTERIVPATTYSDTVQLSIPSGVDLANTRVVAFVQDDNTAEVLGGTRGFELNPYITAPGTQFAVVENFCNTGCYGGPSAIASMFNYAEQAENNSNNEVMVQLHIGQTYGDWSDVYKLPLNGQRYDKYSWDMGIIAGLAAVAKNGIRYKPHAWNNCSPLPKTDIAFVDLQYNDVVGNSMILDYTLSGELNPHDHVYFYIVESDITVNVTGGEVPGTTLEMNNVVRAARYKTVDNLSDTVALQMPADLIQSNSRVLAYIQNDVTYDITGGTKGFELDGLTGIEEGAELVDFSVYPNPASDQINIDLSQWKNIADLELRIHDVNGKLHYLTTFDQAPNLLSIGHLDLDSGIYFVQVLSKEISKVRRLEVLR